MAYHFGQLNNPGNIGYSPWTKAHGGTQSSGRDVDHYLAEFPDLQSGYNAMAALALSKYTAGKTSLDSLIAGKNGWTPGNKAAVENIARYMGVDPNADLNLRDPASMAAFQRALTLQETGSTAQWDQYRATPAGQAGPSVASIAYTGGPPKTAGQQAITAAVGSPAGLTPRGMPRVLRKGATDAKTGGAVTRLQQQLAAVPGGPPVAVDGKYGPQTEAAVRAVEKQYRLPTQDRGVAGPQVQAALAGNERLRTVTDTRQRFGDPLAPGGAPNFSIADPNPPGQRLQAGTGVVSIPTGTGGGVVSGGPPLAHFGPNLNDPAMHGRMYPGNPVSGMAGAGVGFAQPTSATLSHDFRPPAPDLPPLFSDADYAAAAAQDDTRLGQGPAPELVRLAQGAASGGAPSGPPASGYDTRGVSAGLSGSNWGASNYYRQQAAARQAAAPPVGRFGTTDYFPANVSSADYTTGVPGRAGTPFGINTVGDLIPGGPVGDWIRRQLGGGPPSVAAAPRASAGPRPPPSGYVPAAVQPGNQGPELESSWMSGPPQQSSLGGYPRYASGGPFTGTPPQPLVTPQTQPDEISGSGATGQATLPGSGSAGFRVPAGIAQGRIEDPGFLAQYLEAIGGAPAQSIVTPSYLLGNPQNPGTGEAGAFRLPRRFTDPGYRMEGKGLGLQGSLGGYPQVAGLTGSPGTWGDVPRSAQASYTPASASGLLPGEVPTFNGQPISGGLAGQNLGPIGSASGGPPLVNPGGPIVRSGGEFPASDLSQFAPAGDQTIRPAGSLDPVFASGGLYGASADPSRLDPGTLDTAGVAPATAPSTLGGVPYATDPMRRTAGFTNIGNGIVQTPAPRQSLGSRIAVGAVSAGANMLVPGLGLLTRLLGNSIARTGSFDNAQPYRGATGGNYATAAPNPYGGYTTGSSYSASPFTPSGSGWHAPSFSTGSGGALYAYNPETHTYVDSQGRTHSYD